MPEIEIKLRLPGEATRLGVEARCNTFADSTRRLFQRDEYFDSVDGQLKEADLTVRIRANSDVALVALKGPRLRHANGVYERIELEFEVLDLSKIRKRLGEQGLLPTVVIEKRRTEFHANGCIIALDQLPFIGSFVEIEGPSLEAIDAIRTTLELTDYPAVTRNYTELLEEVLPGIGRSVKPQLIATFDEAER